MKSIDALEKIEFNSTEELINYLFENKIVFKVDPETTKDIYILDESKSRNKSLHYTLINRDGKIALNIIK